MLSTVPLVGSSSYSSKSSILSIAVIPGSATQAISHVLKVKKSSTYRYHLVRGRTRQ